MIRIHDSETNEIIDREMTDAEFAEHQKQQVEGVSMAKAKDEAEAAKLSAQAKLEALGLTLDDLKALGL